MIVSGVTRAEFDETLHLLEGIITNEEDLSVRMNNVSVLCADLVTRIGAMEAVVANQQAEIDRLKSLLSEWK